MGIISMRAGRHSVSKYFLLCISICIAYGDSIHSLPSDTDIQNYFTKAGFVLDSNLKLVDCIYVLNLAERETKWNNTQKQLQNSPIVVNRFIGINGWNIPKDELDIFWQKQGYSSQKQPLGPGKIGCVLSHLSIIQDGYERGFNYIWILQDDIDILGDLTKIDTYIQEITELDPEWGLLFTDLDMKQYIKPEKALQACSLGPHAGRTKNSLQWFMQRNNLNDTFQEIRLRYGFHSVVISRKGMELILDYYKHTQILAPFDVDIHFIPKLHKYGLRTPLVSNSCTWLISDTMRENLSSLPSPYSDLETILPYHLHGWYTNQQEIEKIFLKHSPKVVIELGSWLGASTCHMAELLQGKGKLFAVDHWLGSPEHRIINRTDVASLLPTLYEQFLSNIMHRGLTDTVIPWRMTTEQAASKMRNEHIVIDLIYVDAAHDEKSVYADLSNWYPLVRKKGIICGDDWSWGNRYPVRRAVQRFAKERGLKVHVANNNFWLFYKR